MSSPTTTALLAGLVLLLLFFFLRRLLRPSRPGVLRPVPRGPRGHWLLGHLRLPTNDWGPAMLAWRKEHGPIYEFRLLPHRPLFLVINDPAMAKEMLLDKNFASRETQKNGLMGLLNEDLYGIVMQSWSPTLKDLQKFTLSSLSSLGFGRVRMEDKVLAEADALIDAMLKKEGVAFDPENFLRIAVSNVISNIVFSVRADVGRPSVVHDRLRTYVEGLFYLFVHPVYSFAPWVGRIFATGRLKDIFATLDYLRSYIDESLEQHRKTLNPEEPRDLIDAVVIERLQRPGAAHLSDGNVRQTILDLFFAGTDTTSSLMLWTVAWFLHRPDVKAKLVEEVKEIVGVDGAPSLTELHRFHYLQAFLDEVARDSTIVDVGVPHRATKPVVRLGGFDIPDDVVVVANLWGIHHDPDLWEKPMEFRPERFLDSAGHYRKNENLMPFGVGTRRCLGEKLARLEAFIFTVRLLQRVELRVAPGTKLPDMNGRKPIARAPGRYQIVASAVE